MRTAGDIEHQQGCGGSAKELIFLFAYLPARGELSVWHLTSDIDWRHHGIRGILGCIYSGE